MNLESLTSRPSFTLGAMLRNSSIKVVSQTAECILLDGRGDCQQPGQSYTYTSSPRLASDLSAASSMRTTFKPACPSLNGFSCLLMHSTKYPSSSFSASTCSTCGAHMSPER